MAAFKRDKIEIALIVLLYLSAIYIWTLPIQNNRLPFGDVDSSSHFAIGDYMVSHDKSISKVPYYIFTRYGGQNSVLDGYLWYPPQFWTMTGISQILGGERVFPVFVFIAVSGSLIILSSYFLIRGLFGFWPAFLSSFLLIFSLRDYMIYLWGQWPQSLSFAFTPLVLYCFYKYQKFYREKQYKPAYLCVMAVFLSAQFFFHPQGMFASFGALLIFCLVLVVKYKKMPFSVRHFLISVFIFAFISAIFTPFNVGEFFYELGTKQEGKKELQIDKLFKWYQGIHNDPGLPNFYFSYSSAHGTKGDINPQTGEFDNSLITWWTLPFLILGVVALVIRRKDEDFVLLSWLVSFYFLTRLVVFGIGQRDIRMFAYEAHVFYPIIAIGFLSLSSLTKKAIFKNMIKFGSIALFIFFAVYVNGQTAYHFLKGEQYDIGRINPAQYESADWIRRNIPDEGDVYDFGTIGFQNYAKKIKWMGVLSQRHFIVEDGEKNSTDYVLVDYTDALALGRQDYFNAIKNFDAQFLNITPIYNKDSIKVYQIAQAKI